MENFYFRLSTDLVFHCSEQQPQCEHEYDESMAQGGHCLAHLPSILPTVPAQVYFSCARIATHPIHNYGKVITAIGRQTLPMLSSNSEHGLAVFLQ